MSISNPLSQAFSAAGPGGQTLTASFELESYNSSTTVTLGERSQTFDTDSATLRLSLAQTLPTTAPAATTQRFSISIPDLDAVSVSVPDCTPDLPPVVDTNPVSVTTAEDTATPVMIAATHPDGTR